MNNYSNNLTTVNTTQNLTVKNDILKLPEQHIWSEILSIYKFNCSCVSIEGQQQLLLSLVKDDMLFNIIVNVIKSSRQPFQILKQAAEIGMYIPIRYRIGFKAFDFFVQNILSYTSYIKHKPSVFPSLEDIFVHPNRQQLIEKYSDQDILKNLIIKGNTLSSYPDYDNRHIMIQQALNANFSGIGYFTAENVNDKMYNNTNNVIIYTDPGCKLFLSLSDIARGIDFINKQVRLGQRIIHSLSLIQLRVLLLEKYSRLRNIGHECNIILTLVYKLDTIIGKQTVLTDSYLNVPSL